MMDQIRAKLTDALAPESLDVIDESHKHAGHVGARPEGETHFRVEIVSREFAGLSRVERQRLGLGRGRSAHHELGVQTHSKPGDGRKCVRSVHRRPIHRPLPNAHQDRVPGIQIRPIAASADMSGRFRPSPEPEPLAEPEVAVQVRQLARAQTTAQRVKEDVARHRHRINRIEIMPELKDVSPWHVVGQRRRLDEYGRAAERSVPDSIFYEPG